MEDCELQVNSASQASAKRIDEESMAREADVTKLSRLLSEEVEARKDGDRHAGRSLASIKDAIGSEESRYTHEFREFSNRIENCLAGLRVEQKERAALAEELSATVKLHRRQLEEEWKRQCADISSETATTLDELRSSLERELAANKKDNAALPTMAMAIKDLEAGRQRIVEHVQEVRTKLEGERQLRQDGQSGLSEAITAIRGLVAEHISDGHAEVSHEGVHTVKGELETMRDGLTKVAEALQQERSSRQDGDSKLRDDCREAIQQEINARLRLDAKLREQLDQESKQRQDTMVMVQEAIDEVRQGLETHTHEMAYDDQLPDDMVSNAGSASLSGLP